MLNIVKSLSRPKISRFQLFKIYLSHARLSMVKSKVQTTATTTNETSKRSSSSNQSLKSLKSYSSLSSINSIWVRMKIYPIRALQDNYMYLLIDELSRQAAAVDPVNASAMASAINDHGVDLKAILTTHHHYDHAHGNSEMLSMFPDAIVYGGDSRVQALTKSVINGDLIKLGSLFIECLFTPCHTKGHVCYYVSSPSASATLPVNEQEATTNNELAASSSTEKAVFTGDTLFIGGCGRFFEGTAAQMNINLNTILGALPPDTRVFCGHEYTVNNLKFALSVEPQNTEIKTKLAWAQNKVAKREPTVPSTIGEEKKINPFMRLNKSQVQKYTGETDEVEVMTVLRHRKNEFQP